MATPASQHLGVTAPLSTALPTESENQASNALIEELKRQNNYESAADTQKRYVTPVENSYSIRHDCFTLYSSSLTYDLQNRCAAVASRNY
jgi:poly(A) polymerase Pap1